MIRVVKYPRFDASHLIVTYNAGLDEKVQQWKIRKNREQLIAWLKNEHERREAPKKIEFVRMFQNDEGASCALYKFKMNWMGKWLLGIVSEDGCYSAFREHQPKSEEKDAKKLLTEMKKAKKEFA